MVLQIPTSITLPTVIFLMIPFMLIYLLIETVKLPGIYVLAIFIGGVFILLKRLNLSGRTLAVKINEDSLLEE